MSAHKWGALSSTTRASIELQGVAVLRDGRTEYACGCRHVTATELVWLCQYHDGYDDGAEAAAQHERSWRSQATAVLAEWEEVFRVANIEGGYGQSKATLVAAKLRSLMNEPKEAP